MLAFLVSSVIDWSWQARPVFSRDVCAAATAALSRSGHRATVRAVGWAAAPGV